jgi:hypothetical protein
MTMYLSGMVCLTAVAVLAMQLAIGREACAAGPTTGPASQPEPVLRVGKLKVNKVLFLGNSITVHPPAPQIGWFGNWGMAATTAEEDYVHVLTQRLGKAAGGQPQIRLGNIAPFEREFATYDAARGLRDDVAFRADVVIIAVGENVPELTTAQAKADYRTAFAKVLAELKKGNNPAIFVRSSFWPNATKDAIMKSACVEAGGIFVDISALSSAEANYARSEQKIAHAGVAAHPGDRGMAAIAGALWSAIETSAAAATRGD